MSDLVVRRAGEADRAVLERLWLMFRHDLSEFQGQLPRPDGSYKSGWLESVLAGDPDWAGYLFTTGENPVGICFVRALTQPVLVMNTFFIVRPARRSGLGLRAVQEVIAQHPGRWEVPFQGDNATAVRFWRRVAASVAGDEWSEETRPIPGKPDATPDVWISFSTG